MKQLLLIAGLSLALCGSAFAQGADQPPPASTEVPAADAPPPETPPAEAPAAEPAAPQWTGPVVVLQTTMGDIEVTLDMVGAPKTAKQFLGLAKSGHFNGGIFYRVEPGFLIQMGDLDVNLKYRAPKLGKVPLETENNKHVRGALGMAHGDDPNSGQSTFFINVGENTGLGATAGAPPNTTGFAAFGHVTAGMDVVDAINAVERTDKGGPFPGALPKVPVIVKKAVITKAE